MKFKLLTFDATNTILRFRQPPSFYYARTASAYGIELNRNIIENEFRNCYQRYSKLWPNFGLHNGGWRNWWKNVIHDTITLSGGSVTHLVKDNLYLEIIKTFTTEEVYKIDPGFYQLIDRLSRSPIILGIISNTDDRLETILINLKVCHYFDFILTSYKANVLKPSPEIFKQALECAGSDVKSFEALHIGDNIELDYLAARDAGWKSILVSQSFEEDCMKKGVAVDQKFMVKSLQDVINLI